MSVKRLRDHLSCLSSLLTDFKHCPRTTGETIHLPTRCESVSCVAYNESYVRRTLIRHPVYKSHLCAWSTHPTEPLGTSDACLALTSGRLYSRQLPSSLDPKNVSKLLLSPPSSSSKRALLWWACLFPPASLFTQQVGSVLSHIAAPLTCVSELVQCQWQRCSWWTCASLLLLPRDGDAVYHTIHQNLRLIYRPVENLPQNSLRAKGNLKNCYGYWVKWEQNHL